MKIYEKEEKNLNKFAEKLAFSAWFTGHMIGTAHELQVRSALMDGIPIPEKCLPGRFIMGLKDDERKAVNKLRAEHFNARLI